ncbi:MAG: LuxR C-terminal-related transcriptional regulator [Defluviitaleaceae bacterium]|nr:LuxR C-terminal-related transcriptional regulator [Defluviitaleaceae bacterium]
MNVTSNLMIERHGLIRIFNKLKGNHVVVVSAPAGYGKTVAVTQWLSKDSRSSAFYYIDEYDNNLSYFCERFCATLGDCQPQNQNLMDIVSHESFQNAPEEFSLRAIAALSGRKQSVFVIDDLHLIHNDAVLRLLLVFIKRLPKNFQIVLISRHDLPYGLSELWLKGQVGRINAEKLLFSNKDIMALYKKRGSQITDKQAEEISGQTHGWAIGINAFLLSNGELSEQIYNYLEGFIQTNIWEKWDEKTRSFMTHTSNLRELTPSLCEALTGIADSDKFLKELVQKGAFITQLQKGVYRYHHLFQQFLMQMAGERGEEFLHSLIEKEGYWHLSQMDFYSAVDCFIRCKNHEGIVKCFDLLYITDRRNYVVMKLSPIIKHPEVHIASQKYPYILFLMSLFALIEGHAEDAALITDESYTRHDEIASKYPEYLSLFPYMRFWDFRVSLSQILNEIEIISLKIPPSIWTVSLHMPMLHRGIRDFSEVTVGDVVENCKEILSGIGWMIGEEAPILVEILMAELLYEQGHLEKAYEHSIRANAGVRNHFLAEVNFCAMSTLVCVVDALDKGYSKEAAEALQSMSQMIEETKSYHLSHNFNAFKVRREISARNINAAKDWLDMQTFGNSTLHGIYADFTSCRAYIAIGKYDFAIILLKKVLKIADAFKRPLDIIEAQILLALAYWIKKRRFQNEALECLENAVLAAYPFGYVQMFVNESAVLTGMLYKLKKRVELRGDRDKSFISFIKMLYLETRDGMNEELINEPKKNTIKFTDKQTEVIYLLCQGKSYKEISNALGIKQTTLRSRIKLIYSKLEVSNVIDAVTKIKAMGLLK